MHARSSNLLFSDVPIAVSVVVSLNSQFFTSYWRTTVMIGVTEYWFWRNRGLENQVHHRHLLHVYLNQINLKFALFLKCTWISVPNYFLSAVDEGCGLGQAFEWVIWYFLIVHFAEYNSKCFNDEFQ